MPEEKTTGVVREKGQERYVGTKTECVHLFGLDWRSYSVPNNRSLSLSQQLDDRNGFFDLGVVFRSETLHLSGKISDECLAIYLFFLFDVKEHKRKLPPPSLGVHKRLSTSPIHARCHGYMLKYKGKSVCPKE